MEEQASWLTRLVNEHFGALALSLLHALHLSPANAETPIPQYFVMVLVVFVVGILGTLWLRPRLSVDKPGAVQQVAEMLLTNPLGFGIHDLLEENAGHAGLKYVPLVGSISVFILLSNLLSVFPTFSAPT